MILKMDLIKRLMNQVSLVRIMRTKRKRNNRFYKTKETQMKTVEMMSNQKSI
jgi:hypothetical protein